MSTRGFFSSFLFIVAGSTVNGFQAPSINRPLSAAARSCSQRSYAPFGKISMTAAPVLTDENKNKELQGTSTIDRQLLVRIDDVWYDLCRWRQAHPAGNHWIDLFKNQDATEVMYGFHSDKGMGMLKHLPRAKAPADLPPVSQVTRNFRAWRKQLVEEGWWDREWDKEAFNLGSWAFALTLGICLAQFHSSLALQFSAVVVLGIANTAGGWLAHDYVHARGKFGEIMRPFGYLCGGMSTTWWSDKHNVHHARTNEVTVDEDLATEPALFLWAPDPRNDVPWRRFQAMYLPLPMSLLFLIWRFDSVKVALERRKYKELAGLACHYAFMLSLVSPATLLGALLVSGFMTAVITTVTHQSEEMFFGEPPEFVEAQYRSTRDAVCQNPFSEWLWGGMQYQLEHHLFPTMPRYKYPRIQAGVKAFGEANGLDYRVTDELPLLRRNVELYAHVASLPPVPGAKPSRRPDPAGVTSPPPPPSAGP